MEVVDWPADGHRERKVLVRLAERLAVFGRAFRARRLRGDDGLSVMEIVVAMTIIGGVMASASLFFISGLRNTGGQSQRQTAVTLANQALESVQSVSPTSLLSGRDCSSIYTFTHTAVASQILTQDQLASSVAAEPAAGNCDSTSTTNPAIPWTTPATVNGIAYTVDTYIDVCWLTGSASSGTCGPTNTGSLTKMLRATVDVSYAPTSGLSCSGFATARCDYVANTLIDPTADPTFNSNVSTPKVTAVSPASMLVGTTRSITLTGSGFVNGVAVSIASTGGIVTSISGNTGTSLTFTVAAGTTAGTYLVTLLNPDGGTTTTSVVENPLPNITSITPASVASGSTTTLTINGTGFQNGATISVDSGGTLAAATVVSSTTATVSFTSTGLTGTRTLTFTNTDTGSDTGTFSVVNPPNITSITPASVSAGSTTTLTINGTGFVSGATISVDAGGTLASATVVSSTKATVSFTSTGLTGTRTLTFTNLVGGSDTGTFTVISKPTLNTFSSLTCTGAVQTLTISGTGFVSGATVSDGVDTFGAVNVISGTSATVSFTRNLAIGGARTLVFTNSDGGTVSKTLTPTACATMTIASFSPTGSISHNGTTMTITGTNFVSGATVTVSSGTATAVAWVNSSKITFFWTTAARSSFTYTISVKLDGQTVSKTFTVTVT